MRVTPGTARSITTVDQKEHDPLDTRAQEQQAAEESDKQRLRQLQSEADFKWFMSDERGRRFMWGLLGSTGVFRNAFTGGNETFFRCGEQNIGHQLLARIHELCPERYHAMVKEQKDQ